MYEPPFLVRSPVLIAPRGSKSGGEFLGVRGWSTDQ